MIWGVPWQNRTFITTTKKKERKLVKSIRFCPKIWINLKNSNRIQIVSFVRELLLRQRKIKKENYHVEGENLTWKNKRRRRKITEIEIAVANYKSNSGKWSLRSILQYSKPTLTSCKSVDWLNFRTVNVVGMSIEKLFDMWRNDEILKYYVICAAVSALSWLSQFCTSKKRLE